MRNQLSWRYTKKWSWISTWLGRPRPLKAKLQGRPFGHRALRDMHFSLLLNIFISRSSWKCLLLTCKLYNLLLMLLLRSTFILDFREMHSLCVCRDGKNYISRSVCNVNYITDWAPFLELGGWSSSNHEFDRRHIASSSFDCVKSWTTNTDFDIDGSFGRIWHYP